MFETYAKSFMTATRTDPFEIRPWTPDPCIEIKPGLWRRLRVFLAR